jgi:tetratricopeptide (TPR) repeat protein
MAPDHHDALTLLVHLKMARGRIDEAKCAPANLLAKHPTSAEGFWLQGQLEMLNFDTAKAIKSLQRAQTLAPNDSHTLIALGQANHMLQLPTPRPNTPAPCSWTLRSPWHISASGWLHLFENSLNEASGSFSATLRLDNQLADAHAGLVLVYLTQQDLPKAQAALRQSEQTPPTSPYFSSKGRWRTKKAIPN